MSREPESREPAAAVRETGRPCAFDGEGEGAGPLARVWAVLACAAAFGCADVRRTSEAAASPAVTPVASGDAVAEAEILVAAPLADARFFHTATVLDDGRVLVIGGEAGATGALDSAEVYDPAIAAWTRAPGLMSHRRTRHAATALADGHVLVTGGSDGGPALDRAETWDPATGRFDAAGPGRLRIPRAGHTATRLADDRVLIAGGQDGSGAPVDRLEIYDPATATFRLLAARLSVARRHHTATRLADGRVLLAGGCTSAAGATIAVTASLECVDPVAETVVAAGPLSGARADHTATTLASGLVLLAGGTDPGVTDGVRDDAEVFDPAAFGGTGACERLEARLACARTGHTATAMLDGRVLLAGGATGPFPTLSPVTVSLEVFVPDALGRAPAAPFGGLPVTSLFVQPVGTSGTPLVLPEAAQGVAAHAAARLASGEVLLAGGADCVFGSPTAVARTARYRPAPTR